MKEGDEIKHFKGKSRYIYIGESTFCSESAAEKHVVYRSVTTDRLFHRTIEDFTRLVVWPDGVRRPRFVLEGEENE